MDFQTRGLEDHLSWPDDRLIVLDRHALPFPRGLTYDSRKAFLYALDSYFWEGWHNFESIEPAFREEFLQRTASLLLMPDVFSMRFGIDLIDQLMSLGIAIVGSERISLDRNSIRALWHHAVVPNVENLPMLESQVGANDSILIVLSVQISGNERATTIISKIAAGFVEGDAPQRRGQDSALTSLHGPLYAAGDPADFVRDLGVFFSREERARLIDHVMMMKDCSTDAIQLMRELESEKRDSPEA